VSNTRLSAPLSARSLLPKEFQPRILHFVTQKMHVYEVRPGRDKRGVDLISDALPFGRLWYAEPNAIGNAIGYAKLRSRSHDALIRVYDAAGNAMETHERAGEFRKW
jgi:hypothetical protein